MRIEPETFTASASFKEDAKVTMATPVVNAERNKINNMAFAIVRVNECRTGVNNAVSL
ncbi:Uncharacterised protein [Vibrio cholerae]|nr:Uncharacterised protein [Vibrio cholerae]CSC61008.1 Uncharacterised protein [Vibrio cholerae]CSC63114.1 Uncharacterised protein [Vibrio cholerae]